MSSEKAAAPVEASEVALDPERREALKRLGQYAAYTPPAVVMLLASRKAYAESFYDPPGPGAP